MSTEEITAPKPPKAYVGDMTLRLGPLSVRGCLRPIRKSNKSPYKFCTPTDPPQAVRRTYVDADGNLYDEWNLGRATVDEDGVYTRVNKDAIADAKTDSPYVENALDLTLHKRSEVEQYLYPDDSNGYVFEARVLNRSNKVVADPHNDERYEALNQIIQDSKFVAVAPGLVGRSEGFFVLSMYQGHLVVQRYLFPEQLHQYERQTIKLSRNDMTKLKVLKEKLTKPFDPTAYVEDRTRRISEAAQQPLDESSYAGAGKDSNAAEGNVGSLLDDLLADF